MVRFTGKASSYPNLNCVPDTAFVMTPTPDSPMLSLGTSRRLPEFPREHRLSVAAPCLPPSPVDLWVEHWWIPHRG